MAKTVAPVFTPEQMLVLKPAIRKCWNYIGMDVEDACGGDNEGAIELCLDANRLTMCADEPEAEAIVKEVFRTTAYEKVLKFLSKEIPLV